MCDNMKKPATSDSSHDPEISFEKNMSMLKFTEQY